MEKQNINLNTIAYPALVIAADGWVEFWHEQQSLFSASAVSFYNKRRIVIYDMQNQAWLVKRIVPVKTISLLDKFINRRLQVEIHVTQITTSAFAAVLAVLEQAIDADDDILTQNMEADDLKKAIREAHSFEMLLEILRRTGAIWN